MTRREWSSLATVIKDEVDGWAHIEIAQIAVKQVAYRIAAVLSSKHTRFDVKRFLTECGVKSD